jgi:hypothetical protein
MPWFRHQEVEGLVDAAGGLPDELAGGILADAWLRPGDQPNNAAGARSARGIHEQQTDRSRPASRPGLAARDRFAAEAEVE